MLWYRVIVPKVAAGERLPVLYLLHGANSDPADMLEQTDAVRLAAAERLIVVTPEARYSWYTNAKHRRNARWEEAIHRDLRQDVETRFPVLAGREHRGVAGISMGGYGAVKLALKYPKEYGFVASLSGALDITRRGANVMRTGQTWNQWMVFGFRPRTRRDEDVFVLLEQADDPQSVMWFVACGTSDPTYPNNERFLRRMRERGVAVESVIMPGTHSWESWKKMLPQMFKAAGKSLR